MPDGPPDLDWGWPGYECAIPASWPSGVYIAALIEIDAGGHETLPDTVDEFCDRGHGAVRRAAPWSGGAGDDPLQGFLGDVRCLQRHRLWQPVHRGGVVARTAAARVQSDMAASRQRHRGPGDARQFRGLSTTPRRAVRHSNIGMRRCVRWLEAHGYAPHYCTDWELHADPELLAPYSLLLSVGHDEYWSDAMRAALDAHVDRGGNIAFFSGNISGYRIHFTDGDTAITCAKIGPAGKDPDVWERDHWHEVDPECRLTGVATAFGGGWWDGKRATQGYVVQHASHWVFAGTGLRDGGEFGNDEDFPVDRLRGGRRGLSTARRARNLRRARWVRRAISLFLALPNCATAGWRRRQTRRRRWACMSARAAASCSRARRRTGRSWCRAIATWKRLRAMSSIGCALPARVFWDRCRTVRAGCSRAPARRFHFMSILDRLAPRRCTAPGRSRARGSSKKLVR